MNTQEKKWTLDRAYSKVSVAFNNTTNDIETIQLLEEAYDYVLATGMITKAELRANFTPKKLPKFINRLYNQL